MIITESDRDSKSSPPSDSTSIAQTSERFAETSPPAYNYSTGPSTSTASQMSRSIRPSTEPAWKRFGKAFFFAVLIYLLLVMLLQSFFRLAKHHLVQDQPDGPYDTDGRVIRCTRDIFRLEMEESQQHPAIIPPTFPPYNSKISFSVPVSSGLIFLLSRGSYDASSSVTVELSDNHGSDVEIEVAMSYFNNAALKRAQVCLLERDEGGRGVGIFTPRRYLPDVPRDSDRIKFATTLRFPRSGSPDHPLVINALETHVGGWSHQILSLENRVVFKYISIRGSNAPIRVQSVSADVAEFRTSNSAITGSYNVSDSLVLTTSNAPITASIQLENHDGHIPTWLDVKTSNGLIKTPITLLSTQKYFWDQAAFSINIRTSNAPLDVAFPDAPLSPFSLLKMTGKTSNSPANVKLHATYEGSISLKTSSIFTAGLVQRPGTQDPSGKGRHRTVDVRRVVKSVFEAGVWWGDDPNKDDGKGKLVVTTSNSNNMVELG